MFIPAVVIIKASAESLFPLMLLLLSWFEAHPAGSGAAFLFPPCLLIVVLPCQAWAKLSHLLIIKSKNLSILISKFERFRLGKSQFLARE
jgi:hypothetical protein